MSELIGESVIIVRADTRAFLFQVKKAIKEAEAIPVSVTVRASMTGFRADLLEKVKTSSKGVTVKVLVRPDMTGFRTALIAAVKSSSRGVTVPVSVVPVPVKGAPAAGGAAAASGAAAAGGAAEITKATSATVKATAAERAFTEAQKASAFARKRVVGEMSAQEKSLAILAREEAALKASEKAATAAISEQNVELQAQTAELVRRNRAAVESRRGVISRRQARIDAPQAAAQQARQKVLDDAAAIEREKQALIGKSEAAHTQIVQREVNKRAQIEGAFQNREQELRANRASAIDRALQDEQQKEIAQGKAVLNSRAANDEKLLKQRLRLESQLGKLQRQTKALPAPTGLAGNELALASQQAGKTQRAAINAANEAREAGLPTLAKEFEGIESQNNAVREQIALQKRLNTLREQSRVAALPQLGRGPSGGLSKEANALSRAEQAAARLAEDARRSGASSIEQEATALRGTNNQLKEERIQSVRSTDALTKNSRARTDVKRAAQSQLLTFAGLRGAALSAESAFLFAAAGTIAFVKAIQSAAALQTELATFQATAGASAEQMERVSAAALELGRDVTLPGVNAQDAAEALTELSKAGLSVEGSIDGARGVLQLATAASIDNAEATELAASALNAFGLAGSEATHVADVLANAANDSQGSIVDIGIALRQSAAVGRQAGLSFEQVSAALTIFARNGLVGSDAGTSFRTALIRLINPTTKAQKVIDQLGLHLRTSTGAINLGVFDEFARKTKDLTAAQRDQALAIIFGQDAIRGAAILARTGSVAFDRQVKSLDKSGTAAALAAARTQGLAGAMENLKNQLTDAGIGLGTVLIPGLSDLANAVAAAITGTKELVGQVGELASLAVKPIDIVVNLIRKVTGGPGGDEQGGGGSDELTAQKRFRNLFTGGETLPEFLGDVNALGKEANSVFQDAVNRSPIKIQFADFKTLKQGREEAQKIIDDLNKGRNFGLGAPGPEKVNESVLALIALQKQMEKGTLGSKKGAVELGKFIEKLQNLSSTKVEFPDVELPASFLTGATSALDRGGKEAGKFGAESFGAAFIPSMGNAFKLAADAGWTEFKHRIDPGAKEAAAAVREALAPTAAEGQSAGFSRAETQAKIRGDIGGQLSALEGQAASQRKIIARINEISGGDPKDKLLVKRTAAENTLSQALDSITSLKEGQASDAKEAAQKVKDANDKADQAVLDALAPATRRLKTQELIAQGTPRLQDDIRIAEAQKRDNLRQIAVIKKSFNDRKQAGELIAGLKDDNVTLSQSIAADVEGIFTAAQQAFQTKVDALQASGSIDRLIVATRKRITKLEQLIEQSKGEGEKLKAYKKELVQRKQELEQITDERLQARTDFAQATFDLTGNKSPLVKALNAQIKEAQADARAAKRGSVAWLKAMTAVKTFQKAKKDLLNEAKDEPKDRTTAFDLLTEFNAKFNDIAGNAITPNQPFAGGSAFSTDVVNKGIASFGQIGLPHRPIDIRLRGDDAQSKQLTATQELIAVIRENTEVIRGGGGNRSTVSVAVPGEIAGKNKLAAFWAARTARDVHDG